MEIIKLTALFLISLQLSASSGNYKPKTSNSNTNDSGPVDKNYKLYVEDPKPKNERDVKEFVYSVKRKGVTINNINYQQASFTIKGTYTSESNLSQFLANMKKSIKSEKGFDLKTSKTRFAGAVTNHYKVSIDNLF